MKGGRLASKVSPFARAQPDNPGKLASHAFSYEHQELAAYELLGYVAKRAGDRETRGLLPELMTRAGYGPAFRQFTSLDGGTYSQPRTKFEREV